MQPGFGGRVLGQQVEGPGQQHCGGLVAGHEDGDHLVAQLLVGHSLACFLVAGLHQHSQQVILVFVVTAPLVDDAQHDVVHRAHGGQGAPVAQGRPAQGGVEGHLETKADVGQQHADSLAHGVHVGIQPGAEHGLADDGHGQAGQLFGDVERLAGVLSLFPLRQHIQRAAGHDLAEAGDAAAVERRLHQPALAQPQVALAGEQAIAGQLADDVEQVALDVIVVIVLENVLRAVGMVDLVERDVAQPVAGDVAVIGCGAA